MIRFVPLNVSHIPLMRDWLSDGEAKRWYGDDSATEKEFRHKYLVEKPQQGTYSSIIQYEEEFIGHVQCYLISNYPEYYTSISAQPHDYGLDIFIGRDEFIGRGIGTQAIKAALKDLIFSNDDAERCSVGPSPENKRAIRCYEKCGFRHLRTVVLDNNETEYIMAVDRLDNL